MLEELLVLAAEVLAGLLEAVDLVQLVLLLGKRLANDLAGLLVGLVADALCVIARVCHELVGALLGDDEHARDLALGSRKVVLRDDGCGRDGRDLHALGSGVELLLEACDLGLRGRELLLGGVQATLEVRDLLQHRVDLA